MARIIVKNGVNMSGLSTEIWRVAWAIANAFDQHGLECVITSAFRPQKHGSLHHGFALDFRAKHIKTRSQKLKILADLQAVCGPKYDVILHGTGANEHYHVEYDPE